MFGIDSNLLKKWRTQDFHGGGGNPKRRRGANLLFGQIFLFPPLPQGADPGSDVAERNRTSKASYLQPGCRACLRALEAFEFLMLNYELSHILETLFLSFLPPANVVCEGYVFTGVCLSTGGGSPSRGGLHPRGVLHPRGGSSPSWGGVSPSQGGLHPGGVLHPVNVRAVRILLECILVASTSTPKAKTPTFNLH